MTDGGYRVGIIGADTRASWARASHVPAPRARPARAGERRVIRE